MQVRSLPPGERSAATKIAIHEAAAIVKQEILENGESLESKLVLLSSIANCTWQNNFPRAKHLVSKFPLAQEHLDLSSGVVILRDPNCFELQFSLAKMEHLNRQKADLAKEASLNTAVASRAKLKLALLDTKAVLWRPKSAYLAISEVILSQEEAAALGLQSTETSTKEPQLIASAFANAWSQVFGTKGSIANDSLRFVQEYARRNRWQWNLAYPLSKNSTADFLKHARNSAPGWDGIPYAAYKYGGELAIESSDNTRNDLVDGNLPLNHFNLGLWLIPLKNDSFWRGP